MRRRSLRGMIACLLLAATPLVLPVEKTPAAARTVVERYYAALDRGRYASAWRLWSDGGRASGKSLRAFSAGFASTRRTAVTTGAPTDGEGAAGSVYVTVPVRVRATLKNGTHQHYVGNYVLRRVNDVDGATADQLRWHIASAKLREVG